MHTLVTIRFSHYNEKARWALDRFGVPYLERGAMPMLHFAVVAPIALRHRSGRKDRESSPFSTPLLLTDDGQCLHDSKDIVRWASDTYAPPGEDLYPTPEVAELERRFGERIGPHSRRVGYFYAFQDPALVATMADRNVSARQARWFRRVYPVASRAMIRALGIEAARAERSLAVCREEIASVGSMLGDRRYLIGDRFTAADLTFACMIAPLILPTPEEGFGAWFPPLEACPPGFQALAREVRDTPAGRFALRLFKEERGARQVRYDAG